MLYINKLYEKRGRFVEFFELLAGLFDDIDGMVKKSSESFQCTDQVKSEVKKYGYR